MITSEIANGYKNINTGVDKPIIVVNPTFETRKDKTANKIVQLVNDNLFGKSSSKVSAQATINPIAVFKHAKIITIARMTEPAVPKKCCVIKESAIPPFSCTSIKPRLCVPKIAKLK